MALRIRRGLSSDRTLVTPEEGEFLYTTDTYQVYIGDGTTPGGNPLYTLGSLGAIGLTDLSATSPLSYDNTTGVFSIQVASSTQSGYLSNTNWVTFNNKQNALTLTNIGTSGAATLIGSTLNIPIYGSGGSGSGSVTDVSVVTANGFAGTVATSTTTPAITLSTTITGLLKGNGTSISAATAGTDYQSALTGTGLVLSTGGTISYVTNNSTNWNTAYTNRITSLTTTGSSGAATLVSNTLNIPTYTAAGLGAVETTRTISTTTPLQGGGDLSADRTLSILQATTSQSGYLSSTDWNTFNGKQAALSGTGIVKSTSGTISYLTDNSSNWNTAFGWGNHASAGYLLSSTAATTYTPQSRTLTINGTTYDLSANRSWTITTGANTLDALSDVVINGSLAYGDLLQYTTSNQWENVPLSSLTSVGAANGLSFASGDVILGGTLDLNTTINTYKSSTSSQYYLAFTSGSTAFSSPGTAPVKVTDTTAYSAGRSTFYVGANDNHSITAEGKGAPVTTAPTYKYERTSANLLKNATIYSKAKQGLGLYAYVDSDETYTSVTRYATPSIPAILIEKTTGLINSTIANGIAPITANDPFAGNQLFNLLTLRLSRSGTTSNFVSNYGVEMSFESTNAGTSNIVQLANLRAYSASGETSTFSITTRIGDAAVNGSTASINEEYTGLTIEGNGILTLPAYRTGFTLFRDILSVSVTGGVITGIGSVYEDVLKPAIQYGDNVTLVIVDEAGSASSAASASLTLGYSLKRIRITNPGSGYVTAPSVTIDAPPVGGTLPPVGNGWSQGVQAVGTATLTSTGEVDFIKLSNAGTRYTTIPNITIAAPPSGVTATAVAEFGQGEVLNVVVSSGGAGYTSGKVRAIISNQTYNEDLPLALLGVASSGKVIRSAISLDYLLNSNQTSPFGTGSNLLHNTLLQAPGKTFGISAAVVGLTATATGATGANDGVLNIASINAGNRIYINSYPTESTNGITTEGISNTIEVQNASAYSILNQTAYTGVGTFETGTLFNYYGYDTTSARLIEIHAGSSGDAVGTNFSGAGFGVYSLYNGDVATISATPKNLYQGLTSNTWGTAGDGNVTATIFTSLQTNNYTATYEVELGGKHATTVTGYYEDNAGVDTGTYTAAIEANATTSGSVFRGIELVVDSNFNPLTNAISKVQVDTNSIYNELNSNIWKTGSTVDVYARFTQSLQKPNHTANYDTEAGGKYNLHTKGYYEEGVVIGDYNSIVNINSTSEGGSFRGIELIANSNFNPATGTVLDGESKIQVSSTKIYILPNNIGSVNDVLKVANATTGELGYTTLSPIATSGNYSDLVTKPALDDLSNVNAPSPTNGQVLSYNTGASEWQAVTFSASGLTLRTNGTNNGSQSILNLQQGTNITITDNGSGIVTINSSGGSGGVGLDSVFMLMGA